MRDVPISCCTVQNPKLAIGINPLFGKLYERNCGSGVSHFQSQQIRYSSPSSAAYKDPVEIRLRTLSGSGNEKLSSFPLSGLSLQSR